jgi:xylulokinase
MFCAMHEPTIDPSGSGNVFVSPTGEYMSLLAWRNGSLARDRIRTAFDLTWEQFSAKLRETPPGNNDALMLPWFEPEITPPAPAVVTRHNLASGNAGANVRGVVEGQALSMLIHSRWMGKPPKRIRATGGGSANREVLQVIADVFGAEIVRQEGTNAAALGAALRALHGDQLARGAPMGWDEVVAVFSDPSPEPPIRPRAELGKLYQRMAKEMEALIAGL